MDRKTKIEAIKDRLSLAIRQRGLTLNAIADGDMTLSRKLARQINGDTELSADIIVYILDAIPDLSCEWVIRGVGSAFENKPSIEDRMQALEQRMQSLEEKKSQSVMSNAVCNQL